MVKRRMGIMAAALCLCLCLMPCYALAASISTDADCALTIAYRYEDTGFAELPVKVYKIAEVSADFQYTLTPAYANANVLLNGVQTQGEWNVILATLESYILAGNLQADAIGVTDEAGQVRFESLGTGLYLVEAVTVSQGDIHCNFASTLVSLPSLGVDGFWQYDVSIAAKPAIFEPDDDVYYRVLKLWKGDESDVQRPESIEVEIFRNGESHETVVLSEGNQWSYIWSAKDDGANWAVAEKNVPQGYVATVEEKDFVFVLTNTVPAPPTDPPITGDSTNVMLYMILMLLSGSLLIILGITGRKQRR